MTKLDDMIPHNYWSLSSSKRPIVSKVKIGRGMVIDFGKDVFRFDDDGLIIYDHSGRIIPRELVYRGDDGFAFFSDRGSDILCYVDYESYYQIYGVKTEKVEHLL